MSKDNQNIIEFSNVSPKLIRSKRKYEHRLCDHSATLEIDEDTQLVTCSKCNFVMSAFNALMVITLEREDRSEELAQWHKMKQEQSRESKASDVRRAVRELQWIELPEEGDEPARSYWLQLREALGKDPYAMFCHGRGKKPKQYCVLDERGGWSDADFLIATSKAKLSPVGAEG